MGNQTAKMVQQVARWQNRSKKLPVTIVPVKTWAITANSSIWCHSTISKRNQLSLTTAMFPFTNKQQQERNFYATTHSAIAVLFLRAWIHATNYQLQFELAIGIKILGLTRWLSGTYQKTNKILQRKRGSGRGLSWPWLRQPWTSARRRSSGIKKPPLKLGAAKKIPIAINSKTSS